MLLRYSDVLYALCKVFVFLDVAFSPTLHLSVVGLGDCLEEPQEILSIHCDQKQRRIIVLCTLLRGAKGRRVSTHLPEAQTF